MIGGNTKPAGVGTVCWSWRNNEGKNSAYDLPGCCHYLDSPVCILSQTQLSLFLNDCDFGIKNTSGIRTSLFYWDDQKFRQTTKHTTSYMPKMFLMMTTPLLHHYSLHFTHFLTTTQAIPF